MKPRKPTQKHGPPPDLERIDEDYRNDFFEGYVTCALWTEEPDDKSEEPEGAEWVREKLAPETLVAMRKDCDAFIDDHWADLAVYTRPADHAGHDLWLTRCGHGAGFWDRGEGEVGDRLSEACGYGTKHPELWLYVGDDLLIYQS